MLNHLECVSQTNDSQYLSCFAHALSVSRFETAVPFTYLACDARFTHITSASSEIPWHTVSSHSTMAWQMSQRSVASATSHASPAASSGRSINSRLVSPCVWQCTAPSQMSVSCNSSSSLGPTQHSALRQQRNSSCSRAPAAATPSSRPNHVCRALERYLYDKLSAAEMTHKELQLRMADPEVAGDAQEFLRVAKAAGEQRCMTHTV